MMRPEGVGFAVAGTCHGPIKSPCLLPVAGSILVVNRTFVLALSFTYRGACKMQLDWPSFDWSFSSRTPTLITLRARKSVHNLLIGAAMICISQSPTLSHKPAVTPGEVD
jgi:hypothetical protein